METIEQNKMENTEIDIHFEKPIKMVDIQNIKLMIKDDTEEIYANGMTILHTSPTEFRLNFYDCTFADENGQPIGIVKSIIIVHPILIRKIIDALKINLKTYEDRFGKINDIKYSDESLGKIKKSENI